MTLGGVLAVLRLTAAGWFSPSKRTTPASTNAKTGTIVINPQFDSVESFSDGLAVVRIGDDTTGIPLVPFKVYRISDGTDEMLVISDNKRTPGARGPDPRSRVSLVKSSTMSHCGSY